MELANRLKRVLLEQTGHYDKMSKGEFSSYRKKNWENKNKYEMEQIIRYIKEFKKVMPHAMINLKKGDAGHEISKLNDEQILDAWSFNTKRKKEYMIGKEVYSLSFFMNLLDWTEAFAPKDIDKKMEHIYNGIVKEMDNAELNGTIPYDLTILGDDDDLEDEGFFDRYPHLK